MPTRSALQTAALAAVLAASLASVRPAAAQAPAARDPHPHSEAALVADAPSVRAGAEAWVALRLRADDGWHVYWENPGDSGQPPRVDWSAAEGVEAGPLQFPVPQRYAIAGLTSYVHTGETHFPVRLRVAPGAKGTLRLSGTARWLVCADVCLPAEQDVALDLPVGDAAGGGRLADALAALPQAAAGWTAAAVRADTALVLTVAPPVGVTLAGADLFARAAGVLRPGAEPAFRAEGGAFAARLALDGAEAPDTLRAVVALPDGRAVALDVPVASDGVAAAAAAGGGGTLAGMLLLALLGGLILNLMPCVFPILSLKILGFADERDPAALRRHGLAFGAGVVVSFWALAGLLLALRASGAALGWGFQLQQPLVVAALAALMVVLALGLFGVVEIGTGVARAGARLDRGDGVAGAFASGVLAVVVASPCTAPFMGAALGYALAQPAAAALAVFTALGGGMALPYVALSFAPSLVARLPRPGAWMETLKQGLAFPLLLTAVWLVWVYGRQTGIDGAAALLVALVGLALAVWVVGRWPASRVGLRGRLATRSLAVVLAAGAVAVVAIAGGTPMGVYVTPAGAGAREAAGADGWAPFEQDAVDRLVAAGSPVFVDYTAAWCLTCQVNKRTTLHTDAVARAFRDAGVARVRADWTSRDAAITASLDRFGRSGVPLYVFYAGGGAAPVLLPEVLTPGLVLDALAAARRPARP